MPVNRRIAAAAEELGYTDPVLRGGGHYSVTHPDTGKLVVIPATASDRRSIQNTISQLERSSGKKLDKSNGFTKGRYRRCGPAYYAQPRTEAEERASKTVDDILYSVGEVDNLLEDLVDHLGELEPGSPAAASALHRLAELRRRRSLLEKAAARLFHVVPAPDIPGLEAVCAQHAPDSGATDITTLREKFNRR